MLILKLQPSGLLNLITFKISSADELQNQHVRHTAIFCSDSLNRCREMVIFIFNFFKISAVRFAILDSKN